jgi:hypothetical protein
MRSEIVGFSEITVRDSFLKVDPWRDYQPTVYSGDRMERFGGSVNARPEYAPQHRVVESAGHRFIDRHNPRMASHRRDAAGERAPCRTDADCDDGRGRRAMWFSRAYRRREGACTIPCRDRVVRPVVYHLSRGFPADLVPDAEHVASEWNAAFSENLGSASESECLRTGGDAASCAAERRRPDAAEIFVLCNRPLCPGDLEPCSARGTVAPIGDLRDSMMAWVGEPRFSSPLGYGPSSADPETGGSFEPTPSSAAGASRRRRASSGTSWPCSTAN